MKRFVLLLAIACLFGIAAQAQNEYSGNYTKKVSKSYRFSDGTVGYKIWCNGFGIQADDKDSKGSYVDNPYFYIQVSGPYARISNDENGWTRKILGGDYWPLQVSLKDAVKDKYILKRIDFETVAKPVKGKNGGKVTLASGNTGTLSGATVYTGTFTWTPDNDREKGVKINVKIGQYIKTVMVVLLPKEKVETPVKSVKDEVFEVNGVKFKMIGVPGGTFTMGPDPVNKEGGAAHKVTLSDYLIGETEVTQELWNAVMGGSKNPSPVKDKTFPVYKLMYEEAQQFVIRLSALTGREFSLPTEAQWEYAAMGGPYSKGLEFSGSAEAETVGWVKANAKGKYHPVKKKNPNELGIYDMTGNAIEWVSDPNSKYPTKAVKDPKIGVPWGTEADTYFVARGGSCETGGRWPVKRRYSGVINQDFFIKVLKPGMRVALKPKK